ncbi:hypothetical protein [Sulfurospirillum arcachonense]|uniref:hypothetical protein n=1 Tax=Sulfurospirillum arcachonense TaxID=57666 RepID=UPI00046AFBF1|nr:hypothetical protein [Sulfurospirillum arcachonense]
MIKKILFLTLFSVYIFGASFKVSDTIGSFSLPDQFDKVHVVDNKAKIIIVSFEKDTGKLVNDFLASKEPSFLQEHKAVFIADISLMPSIITKLFALPKMRDYKHDILLIYKENDDRFLHKEDQSTIYKLENGVIKSINFITTKEDLAKVFE